MVAFGSKIAIAYLFMLLIMRKVQCSENRQIRIPSRFESVRIDPVAAPYMLNGSPHSAALKCKDLFTAN